MNTNGVIRIGRKGLKKFAFGEDGPVFEVDVVVAFQHWIEIDESFRPAEVDSEGNRPIPTTSMPEYHQAAVRFAVECMQTGSSISTELNSRITVAEALDFIARLREQYDELASFFRPKSREERASPDSSEVGLRFSVEES